jgi:GNAT superfamily N-acetyltransferase
MTYTYRRATPQDTPELYKVCELAAADLARRKRYPWDNDPDDPVLWARRRPLYDHLAATAGESWVAVDAAGQIAGHARSIVRDDVRELTELFVRPGHQSGGVGRALLARAFPPGARQRFIVATSDTRALASYLKTGLSVRFPIYEFRGAPQPVPVTSDLDFAPMGAEAPDLVAAIDQAVLGYRRDTDHVWLATHRTGFVVRRGQAVVGYGYLGDDNGPFAVLRAEDMSVLLAHAEALAHARGITDIGFEVPLINREAVAHLLGRGYKMQEFFAFLMSDGPTAGFENYVVFGPPYFI